VLFEAPDAITVVLVSSVNFLNGKRELLRKFVAAHRDLTDWIQRNRDEAQRMVREELAAETRAVIGPELIARAWKRLVETP
jgi:NitT/TauT family transport system substrate-binding protein